MPMLDIEALVTTRVVIKRAVTQKELEQHHANSPTKCACEIIETGGLLGAVGAEGFHDIRVLEARTKRSNGK